MIRTIVTVALLVILVVLVAFNIGSTASVSLFGARFEGVPVISISLGSFALGAMFSLLLSVGHEVRKRRREGLKEKDRILRERESSLTAREGAWSGAPKALQSESAWERVVGFFTRKR
jgi:uncharacterized integral membrane protein